VEVPAATILSLSVASAQAVFAVDGLVFVSLLRKLENPGKYTSTLVDDDLHILVRKLRVGQDELRRDFHNRQEELCGGQIRHGSLFKTSSRMPEITKRDYSRRIHSVVQSIGDGMVLPGC